MKRITAEEAGRIVERAGLLTDEEWAGQELLKDIEELRGKDLVCGCHAWDGTGLNPRYCHADILLELANK